MRVAFIWLLLAIGLGSCPAQANSETQAGSPATSSTQEPQQGSNSGTTTATNTGGNAAPQPTPIQLSLQDAIHRAQALSPDLQSAATDAGVAHYDHSIARLALLPSIVYNNEFLYTEPLRGVTATNDTPRFIANNGVHEYLSQADIHEAISFGQISEYRRTHAAEAAAKARLAVASRGLVVTVVQAYFAAAAGQQKLSIAQLASADADRFLLLSQQLEQGGEVAHADVIKAQLQANDRHRDLKEAQLVAEKSRLDLTILTMPDLSQDFVLSESLDTTPELPAETEFEQEAKKNNPQLAVAMSALREAQLEVTSAQAAYFPGVTLDYFYGIDANQLAIHNPDGTRNVGYSTSATLNIPIWDWGATHSRVKQSELREKLARTQLTFAQRQLVSDLLTRYHEAAAAHDELEALRASASLAEESLRLTELRYRAGESTVLELVDAQTTLAVSRNAYADGEVRYRVALAGLQTLTGKLQ